jgi:PQQ-dependent catabolism-associated CXXCW motif protein
MMCSAKRVYRYTIGCALAAGLYAVAASAAVPEPSGLRMDHYRAPVPDTLQGAVVMHTADLARLLAATPPLLIDVLPAPSPPPDSRPGLPRLPIPHRDIPGSVWWPDVGRGALTQAAEARFKQRLATVAGAPPGPPIVIYCLSQCWMSWNAAKRAVGYGYTHVIWYPDGADGWQAAGLQTAPAQPAP